MTDKNRQLAAILFTDMVGYTQMMQQDEKSAVLLTHRYVEVLKKVVEKFGGTILNDYGDGSLCTFSSATAAISCAMEMQRQLQDPPAVPLRIGLHIGEIFFEQGKVFGDGVNIASRIQSLGVANSILFSSEINSKLKNQSEFKSISLGNFRFKNVDEPHEVFALANPGFIVPEKKNLAGKLQPKKKSNKRIALIAGFLLLAIASFFAYRHFTKRPSFSGKEKSIAVLPFDNVGADNSQEYLSDGITQDIINNLSKISALQKVIGWFSVKGFKKTTKTPSEIAGELDVAAILTGTIQSDHGKIHVIAELIDVSDNKRLWGADYDFANEDILSIQSNVASQIVDALQASITPAERKGLTKKYTENVEAYKFYRRGRVFWDQRSKESYDSAELYYKKAIDLDPDYALAYAGLADLYTFNQKGLLQAEAIPIAREYANKALKLDSTLTEALTTMAFIQSHYDYDFTGAEKSFQKIIQDDPNYAIAHLYLSNVKLYEGKFDECIAEAKKALSLDPLSNVINYVLGRHYYYARKYDSAVAQLQKDLTLNPKFVNIDIPLGQAYVQLKQYSKAIDAFSKIPPRPFDQGSNGILMLSYAYSMSGNLTKGKELLSQVSEEDLRKCAYFATYAHLAAGDVSAAIASLKTAIELHNIGTVFTGYDPALDALNSNPEFIALKKALYKN